MSNLLSLSIDINAIGWCITHPDSGKIKDMGVHVFPVGSENYGSGSRELSKKTARSIKRTHRVRYARKRERKMKVLSLLAKHQLCSVPPSELKSWATSHKLPKKLIQWMALNPYDLRKKGLHAPLDLIELGRVLYHYAQRRGFPLGDSGDANSGNILLKGMPNYSRPGISAIEQQQQANYLIDALYPILPQKNSSYIHSEERVRNRFLSRASYRQEAHTLWEKQTEYHKETLTVALKEELIGQAPDDNPYSGAVFYQRPLKSQKYRVGKCMYEPQKTKCCVSSLLYQELLAYKWSNTIKKNGRPLNEKERERVVRYFLKHRKFQFYEIRKMLNPATAVYNKKDDELIVGSFIHSELSKHFYFGNQWFEFSSKQQEDIWHALYFYTDKDRLVALAENQWGFATPQALKIANIKLDKRYAPLSKKATGNILYFMKRGIGYDYAVVLAGVKNALGKKWDLVAESDVNYVIKTILKLYEDNADAGFIPALQAFLQEEMQLSYLQIKKMYGPAAHMGPVEVVQKIPVTPEINKEIEDFKKPLLITALFQLRKLINALIDAHGPMTSVKIEVNPNLKINKFQRYLQRIDQRRLSKYRTSIVKILGERAENVTPMNILKYHLWEECKNTCPYTGEAISLDDLFSEAIQIVYINPWERSLNDDDDNKTLCVASFAKMLESYTPYEFFSEHRPYMWEEVVLRAARLFSNSTTHPNSYNKFRVFVKKHHRKYLTRAPFVDHSFFAKELECFVNKICQNVQVLPPYPIPMYMDLWRLQPLVPTMQLHEHCEDFRSYALRAFVIGSTTKENLTALSKRNKYIRLESDSFPEPYPGFRDAVELRLNAMFVSHRSERQVISKRKLRYFHKGAKKTSLSVAVRGSLHKETIYGKHLHSDGEHYYHIRKPLEFISTQHQIEKIVDPQVRKQLETTIAKSGGYKEGKVPLHCFFDKDENGKLIPKVYMPNYRGGTPVPIRKVRLREVMQGAVQLKSGLNQYVNLRNNHHIVIYKNRKGEFSEYVVSFWEAVQRCVSQQPLYQLPKNGLEWITTLHINDLFILGVKDLEEDLSKESRPFLMQHLYRVQKLSSKFYEFRLAYNNTIQQTDAPIYIRINNFGDRKTGWNKHYPTKVHVSITGQLQRAALQTTKKLSSMR